MGDIQVSAHRVALAGYQQILVADDAGNTDRVQIRVESWPCPSTSGWSATAVRLISSPPHTLVPYLSFSIEAGIP